MPCAARHRHAGQCRGHGPRRPRGAGAAGASAFLLLPIGGIPGDAGHLPRWRAPTAGCPSPPPPGSDPGPGRGVWRGAGEGGTRGGAYGKGEGRGEGQGRRRMARHTEARAAPCPPSAPARSARAAAAGMPRVHADPRPRRAGRIRSGRRAAPRPLGRWGGGSGEGKHGAEAALVVLASPFAVPRKGVARGAPADLQRRGRAPRAGSVQDRVQRVSCERCLCCQPAALGSEGTGASGRDRFCARGACRGTLRRHCSLQSQAEVPACHLRAAPCFDSKQQFPTATNPKAHQPLLPLGQQPQRAAREQRRRQRRRAAQACERVRGRRRAGAHQGGHLHFELWRQVGRQRGRTLLDDKLSSASE
jgi:hypothetical protein